MTSIKDFTMINSELESIMNNPNKLDEIKDTSMRRKIEKKIVQHVLIQKYATVMTKNFIVESVLKEALADKFGKDDKRCNFFAEIENDPFGLLDALETNLKVKDVIENEMKAVATIQNDFHLVKLNAWVTKILASNMDNRLLQDDDRITESSNSNGHQATNAATVYGDAPEEKMRVLKDIFTIIEVTFADCFESTYGTFNQSNGFGKMFEFVSESCQWVKELNSNNSKQKLEQNMKLEYCLYTMMEFAFQRNNDMATRRLSKFLTEVLYDKLAKLMTTDGTPSYKIKELSKYLGCVSVMETQEGVDKESYLPPQMKKNKQVFKLINLIITKLINQPEKQRLAALQVVGRMEAFYWNLPIGPYRLNSENEDYDESTIVHGLRFNEWDSDAQRFIKDNLFICDEEHLPTLSDPSEVWNMLYPQLKNKNNALGIIFEGNRMCITEGGLLCCLAILEQQTNSGGEARKYITKLFQCATQNGEVLTNVKEFVSSKRVKSYEERVVTGQYFTLEDFSFLGFLNWGSFGSTFEVTLNRNKFSDAGIVPSQMPKMVLKLILVNLNSFSASEGIMQLRELVRGSKVDSQFVAKILAYFPCPNFNISPNRKGNDSSDGAITSRSSRRWCTFGIVMEHAGMFTVHDVLEQCLHNEAEKDLDVCLRIMEQVIQGVADMKKAGVQHCDIKPDNICYNHEKKTAKIVDFGTMRERRKNVTSSCFLTNTTTNPGTLGFAPPEPDEDEKYDEYSCGVIMYQFMVEHPRDKSDEPRVYQFPFENKEDHKTFKNRERERIYDRSLIKELQNENVKNKFLDLVAGLLCYDTNKRMECNTALKVIQEIKTLREDDKEQKENIVPTVNATVHNNTVSKRRVNLDDMCGPPIKKPRFF